MQPETLENHYIPAKIAEIKIQYQVLKKCGANKTFLYCQRQCEMVKFGKQFGSFL